MIKPFLTRSLDKEIQRGLGDRLYEKRKAAALELERVVRDLAQENKTQKIDEIIQQLQKDFTYAVNYPNARNGGLIGLAATAIGLGTVSS